MIQSTFETIWCGFEGYCGFDERVPTLDYFDGDFSSMLRAHVGPLSFCQNTVLTLHIEMYVGRCSAAERETSYAGAWLQLAGNVVIEG
jgi:hypothetical protein